LRTIDEFVRHVRESTISSGGKRRSRSRSSALRWSCPIGKAAYRSGPKQYANSQRWFGDRVGSRFLRFILFIFSR
jgi:hypothetical protein